jgi:hypothetical protein
MLTNNMNNYIQKQEYINQIESDEAIKRLNKRMVYANKLLKTKSLFEVIQIMKTKKDI